MITKEDRDFIIKVATQNEEMKKKVEYIEECMKKFDDEMDAVHRAMQLHSQEAATIKQFMVTMNEVAATYLREEKEKEKTRKEEKPKKGIKDIIMDFLRIKITITSREKQ